MDAVDNLKLNFIEEFNNKLTLINKGHVVDLEGLLSKIDFIEYCDKIDNVNFVYSYLINN